MTRVDDSRGSSLHRRTLLAGSLAAAAALSVDREAGATRVAPEPRRGDRVAWKRLPDLPANTHDWSPAIPVGQPSWSQVGLAGLVAGAHGDFLLAGGGANFPEPALTATRANTLGKVYWDELFVMRSSDGGFAWLPQTLRLPDAVAYAACLSTPRGVLVIGGEGFRGGASGNKDSAAEKFADVYYLRFDPADGRLIRDALPDLPRPTSYAVAGLVDGVAYVAEGGDFWSLDLRDPGVGWQTLEPWPGDPRSVSVGGAQRGHFFLISGRSRRPDGSWVFHEDAYSYDVRRARWRRIADVPWCVTAGLAHASGRGDLLVVGGDRDLGRWNLIEQEVAQRDSFPPGSADWRRHNDAVTFIYDHHTGFNQEVLSYDVIHDQWTTLGWFPGPAQVTTPAVRWGDDLVVVSGEVGPGIRTPRVWHGGVGR